MRLQFSASLSTLGETPSFARSVCICQKEPNVKRTLLLLLAACVTLMSCTKYEAPTTSPQTVSTTVTSAYALGGRTHIAVRNAIGPLTLIGGETDASVNIVMNLQVTSLEGLKAFTQLSSIQVVDQSQGDTLRLVVNYPRSEPRYVYAAHPTFLTPYRVACSIDSVQGVVTVSDLGALLTIRNAHAVRVMRHDGSCNIESIDGGVYAEVKLSANGNCVVNVASGDITLKVPASTSANVTARSLSGTVSHSGLTFSGLNQQQSSLTGRLGTGNGEIRLETASGNIVIQVWPL